MPVAGGTRPLVPTVPPPPSRRLLPLALALSFALPGTAKAQLTLNLIGEDGSRVVQFQASGSWTVSESERGAIRTGPQSRATRGPLDGERSWSENWSRHIGNFLRDFDPRRNDDLQLSGPVVYRKNGTEFARLPRIDLNPFSRSGDDVVILVHSQGTIYPVVSVGDELSWSGSGTFTLDDNFEVVFEDVFSPNNVFQRNGSAFRLVIVRKSPATGRPEVADATPATPPSPGDTLTASPGDIADLNGLDNVAYAWQWEESDPGVDSGWNGIAGATEITFTVTRAQAGRRLRVRAEFTDDAGNTEMRRSEDDHLARVPNVVRIERDGSGHLDEGDKFRIDAERFGDTRNRAQVHLVFRAGSLNGPPETADICNGRPISSIPFTFGAGRTNFNNIERGICNDDVPEPRESVWAVIDEARLPEGHVADPDERAAELLVERSDVEVSVADAETTEGSPVTFTVSLNQAISEDVVASYTTRDGTADADDYTPVTTATEVTVAAGSRSRTFEVATANDDDEADETFTVTLAGVTLPAGVILGDATATGTIRPLTLTLDVDGNDEVEALTDGLLVLRALLRNLDSDQVSLTNALGTDATRTTATEIVEYLQEGLASLDVDGNDEVEALTDGLLILRVLLRNLDSDQVSLTNALGTDATRTTATDIVNYVRTLMPE